MSKITATYNAPEGDNEVVTMRGVRFFDGQATELDPVVHSDLIKKLRGNGLFEVHGADEEPEEPASEGLVAKHRGRGTYGVFDGDQLLDGIPPMTKDDADAFNAKTDAEKQAFVDNPPA